MGRALLVVDEGVDQGVAATVAAGREVLSKGGLRTFTGEKSQDVLYLCANPQAFSDDAMLFDDLLDKVMAASGSFSIRALQAGAEQVLARALRLNGFVEVEVKGDGLVTGKKDSVEVGFVKTLNIDGAGSSDGAWKISMEDEYIDDSELLDEEDLARPDPASLKVCGTTGKRKACKDCSCGLAEELAIGGQGDAAPKSNCGSCYLGDAFRCGSCPYLGTPPFKPGEKVTLSAEPDL